MSTYTGHRAKKRFGQNFLHDKIVIDQIISAIKPKVGETLLEIGPGQAALTAPLIKRAQHIWALELDRDLIAGLRARYNEGQLTLYNVDALKFDFNTLKEQQPIRVVGNLPYNISTPLLFHLLKYKSLFQDMYFMLQKEVGMRIAAKPGSKIYGRLSLMMQYHCRVDNLFVVAPTAFTPMPAVESVIVSLKPYATPPVEVGDERVFASLVTQAFSMRRKTLYNNLKSIISKEEITSCNLDPSTRPEQLSLAEFAALSAFVTSKA